MNILIQILRFLFRFIVPFLFVLIFFLKTYIVPEFVLLNYVYIILLSSMVGYFTNFIAIKMLFHPKKKTIFRRQGMIPANQMKIAEKLGSNIADQFFLPSDISTYLLDQKIIHQMIEQGRDILHKKLSEAETQEQIRIWLFNFLDKNADKIQTLFDHLADKDIASLFEEQVPVGTFLDYLTNLVEKGINDGSVDLEWITEWLADVLHEYTPQISRIIYEQFQGYMEQQSSLKKGALKLIQWMSDFEPEKLQNILYEKFSSQEFREQAYVTIKEWIHRLIDYLKSEKGAKKVNQYYHQLIQALYSWVQVKGAPLMLEKIKSSLSGQKSWQTIEKALLFIFKMIEKESHYFVQSRTFKKLINQGTYHILSKMKISKMIQDKVKNFNTDELENLILNTSGEQLGAIEILGGFLGAFTGIAIFNPYLFFWILLAILLVFLIEKVLEKIV